MVRTLQKHKAMVLTTRGGSGGSPKALSFSGSGAGSEKHPLARRGRRTTLEVYFKSFSEVVLVVLFVHPGLLGGSPGIPGSRGVPGSRAPLEAGTPVYPGPPGNWVYPAPGCLRDPGVPGTRVYPGPARTRYFGIPGTQVNLGPGCTRDLGTWGIAWGH